MKHTNISVPEILRKLSCEERQLVLTRIQRASVYERYIRKDSREVQQRRPGLHPLHTPPGGQRPNHWTPASRLLSQFVDLGENTLKTKKKDTFYLRKVSVILKKFQHEIGLA